MYNLAKRIFPICRSITGEGVRETIDILSEYIKQDGLEFNVFEIPSGTPVYDWIIPKEWVIKDAYIEDGNGNKIIDMKKNNLHVVGYSTSVDSWVSLEELRSYVYTQPEQPSVIPYVTSYYEDRCGFCMSQNQLDSLKKDQYHIFIDSKKIDGSLTYAELVLPGELEDELLITSYTCHPSMANNECSGPTVLSELIRYVASLKRHRYTYRFVLNPETIGALAYLSKNLNRLRERLVAGVVLSCVGDERDYSVIHSRYADSIADRSLVAVLKSRGDFSEYSFLERGSDERQYNAPGVDLPVVGFCRTKYGEYPEYHTSADDLRLISPSGLQGAYETMTQWIDCMEMNFKYRVSVLGEPQLGKRGLYPTVSQKGSYDEVESMMNLIAYSDGSNDLFDISEIIGVSPQTLCLIVEKLVENGLLVYE